MVKLIKVLLTNVKYFASVDPKDNGGRRTINDNPEFTRNKTDIKATYVEDREGKWIVYDVFFNNDGKKMTRFSYQQEYYFQGPFNIMDLTSDGLYNTNNGKRPNISHVMLLRIQMLVKNFLMDLMHLNHMGTQLISRNFGTRTMISLMLINEQYMIQDQEYIVITSVGMYSSTIKMTLR